MKNPVNYNKPTAKAVLGRMLELLARGSATTVELIAASGKSGGRARDYLMHLRNSGQVYCLAEAQFSFDGSKPAVWALEPTYVAPPPSLDEALDTVDHFPRRVIVRQQWEPNHVRMTIDCLLFGVPKVLQGAAA